MFQEDNTRDDRFNFLDGYRGSLAIIVVMVHSSGTVGTHYSGMLSPISQKYSIAGFFLLSSFLLTYKLIKDLHKPNVKILITFIQYFIRRIFRIYFIFIAFCTAGIYYRHIFQGFLSGKYTNLYDTLTLGYAGFNILWTIPSELRYYFVIPVIGFVFSHFKRFQFLFLVVSILLAAYDQFFNFFGTSWEVGVKFDSSESNLLKNHFFVFFVGSIMAMALFLIERNENIMSFIRQRQIQSVLVFMSLILAVYAVYTQSGAFGNMYDYR